MKKTILLRCTHPLWALFVVPLPVVAALVWLLVTGGLLAFTSLLFYILLGVLAYLTVYAIRCRGQYYEGAPMQTGILLGVTASTAVFAALPLQLPFSEITAWPFLAAAVALALSFVWLIPVKSGAAHWALRIVSVLPYLLAIACIVLSAMDISLFDKIPAADSPSGFSGFNPLPPIDANLIVGLPLVLPVSSTMALFILTAKKL